MTSRAVYVCDGCSAATVDIPMPDTKAPTRLLDAVIAARWTTPLPDVWLCPACAAVTDIEGVAPVETLAMFGGEA